MSDKLVRFGEITEADPDPRDREIETLKADNRRLQREASDADLRANRAREDADRALSALRRQLGPLYRALQAVFGELDAVGVTESPEPGAAQPLPPTGGTGPDARVKAVWDAWKQKLGIPPGRIIDALLIHGEMNTTQLSVAAQMHPRNVAKAIQKLKQVGLINKNGGRFSLKQL